MATATVGVVKKFTLILSEEEALFIKDVMQNSPPGEYEDTRKLREAIFTELKNIIFYSKV